MKLKVVEHFESFIDYNNWLVPFVNEHRDARLDIVLEKKSMKSSVSLFICVVGYYVKPEKGGSSDSK